MVYLQHPRAEVTLDVPAAQEQAWRDQGWVTPGAGGASGPLGGPLRVAFLGDSITEGAHASNVEYAWSHLAPHVAGTAYVSADQSLYLGVGGQTTDQILARLPGALAANPDVVVWMSGLNDNALAVQAYGAKIARVATACRAANADLIVMTVTPRGPSQSIEMRTAIEGYNTWIRLNARLYGYRVVDAYAALVDPVSGSLRPEYESPLADDVHLNDLGHSILGRLAGTALHELAVSRGVTPVVASADSIAGMVPNPTNAGPPGGWAYAWWYMVGGEGATYQVRPDTSKLLPAGMGWFELDLAALAGNDGLRRVAVTVDNTGGASWSPGDQCAFAGMAVVESYTGADWLTQESTGAAEVNLAALNLGVSAMQKSWERNPGRVDSSGRVILGPWLRKFTLPATGMVDLAVWSNVTIPPPAHGVVRWGAVDVLNLTRAGLVGVL